MKKSGFWRRFWASLIDGIVVCAVVSPLAVISSGSSIQYCFWPLGILYNTVLLSQWDGRTIGKKILGIKVVTTSGEKLDWLKAFIRETGKILSSLALCLGYLWMLWDERSQTWHDKIADTVVVEA